MIDYDQMLANALRPAHGITINRSGFDMQRRWGVLGAFGKIPPPVLQEATLWLDAQYSVAGETTVVNQGTGGSALNARYGSTSGSDTNDPLLLTHTGENYVYFPGATGNYLSTPDAAALDITGDIDVAVEVALGDWSPAATTPLVGKWGAASQRSWYLRVDTAGTLTVLWTPDGTLAGFLSATSTANLSSTPSNTRQWVRFTLDVDNGASGRTIRFYTSVDGSSWTQLGADVVQAGVTSIFAGTDPVEVGGLSAGLFAPCSIYRTIIRDGIDGTAVFDFNAATDITDAGATSFTASSGQTVTVNRATSGRKTVLVTRPVWLFGTDDYLEVADNALLDFGASDDFTQLVVVRPWATQASNTRLFDKRQSGDLAGYGLSIVTGPLFNGNIDAGASESNRSSAITLGGLQVTGQMIDRTAQEHRSFTNNTINSPGAIGAIGSLESTAPLRVGALGSGSNYGEFECVAVAVWRRVLTADEIAAINTYYSTGA